MFKTIEVAKTQWCPFTRVGLTVGNSPNRTASMPECGGPGGGYADVTAETRCLADGCAVWVPRDQKRGRCGLVNPRLP